MILREEIEEDFKNTDKEELYKVLNDKANNTEKN